MDKIINSILKTIEVVYRIVIKKIILAAMIISIVLIFKVKEINNFYKIIILLLILGLSIEFSFVERFKIIKNENFWIKNKNIFFGIVCILLILNSSTTKQIQYFLQQAIKRNIFLKGLFGEKIYSYSINNSFYDFINRIIILLFIYIILSTLLEIKEEVVFNNQKIKLLSFRKNDLEKLKQIVDKENINSILLDDKIGNGKSKLIEKFIEEKGKKAEIIYFKLPLFEDVRDFKNSIYLEINRIFKENRIKTNYFQNLVKENCKIKTNYFELNLNFKNNNWKTIQEIKNSIEKLEKKGKSIVIIIDDIEREKDETYIKESICFLGELSESFRETKTTIIYVAQYDNILKRLKEKESDFIKNRMLDKYFEIHFKLEKFEFSKLELEDLKTLNLKKINKKDLNNNDDYFKLILILLKNFESASGKFKNIFKENENIRNVKKYLNYTNVFFEGKDINQSIWIIFFICSLIDILFLDKELAGLTEKKEDELIRRLYSIVIKELNLNLRFSLSEAKRIKERYFKRELITEELLSEAEKILDFLKNKKNKKFESDNSEELDYLTSKIISDYIYLDKEMFKKLIDSKIKLEREILMNKIIEFKSIDFLSEFQKDFIKEIFLKKVPDSIIENQYKENANYIEKHGDDLAISREKSIKEVEKYSEKVKTNKKKLFEILEKGNIIDKDIEKNIEDYCQLMISDTVTENGL